jgi:hypothetical protein
LELLSETVFLKVITFGITFRNSVLKSNTILVLLSETVFLIVIPFWYYSQKYFFEK